MFDMDNTLLKSSIPFQKMKADLISFLVDSGLGTQTDYASLATAAQVIEKAKRFNQAHAPDPAIEKHIWQIVTAHEASGMRHAVLETGVKEGLDKLKEAGFILTVVTNNAYSAACQALKQCKIDAYFAQIVGREQMTALKPSPSGLLLIKEKYAREVDRWLMLGDSWIDGKAAAKAGIDFISYKGDLPKMHEQGVYPVHAVDNFHQFVLWVFSSSS